MQEIVTVKANSDCLFGLMDVKKNRERMYNPPILKGDGLQFESRNLIMQYIDNLHIILLSMLHQNRDLIDGGLDNLKEWIRKRRAD